MSRFGADEETPLRDRYWHPQPGQVVIDIGCFHGSWTLPALEAGAFVLAVDGRLGPLDVLRKRVEQFGLTGLSLNLASVGRPYSPEHVEAIRTGPKPSRQMVPDAPWTTLDELVWDARLSRVDWIKIDVEGGEVGVLESGAGTLSKYGPRLVIEDHSKVYPWLAEQGNTNRILEILHEHDYETELIESYPDYVIAQRP